MRIKKKSVARLASLSALGAGALGVAAGTAQASDIIYTPLSDKVGFSGGYGSSAYVHLPGTALIAVKRQQGTFSWGPFWRVRFYDWSGSVNFKLSNTGTHLGVFNAGKTWLNTGKGSWGFTNIATRWTSQGSVGYYGNGPLDHKYALFKFYDTTSSHTDYGWLQLSQSISNTTGPDVTLYGWAYDDTGAKIAAGDTGAGGGSVPEPSTMALTGLAALALGAAGLRRWRAARKLAA